MLPARRAGFTSSLTLPCPVQVVCKVSLAPKAGLTQPCGAQSAQQDVYNPGRGSFAQEPIFVPRPGAEASTQGGGRGALCAITCWAPPHCQGCARARLAWAAPSAARGVELFPAARVAAAGGGRRVGAGPGV